MRLRRTVLTSALTVALATSLVAPAAEASAQTTYKRITQVTLTSKHLKNGDLDLIAHSSWHHAMRNGEVRAGTTAGLPCAFQTYRAGKWVSIKVLDGNPKTQPNGTCAIHGAVPAKARYRALIKPITKGKYHYTGSKSKAIRA